MSNSKNSNSKKDLINKPSIHLYINIIFFFCLIFTLCSNFSNIIILKNSDSSYITNLAENWRLPTLKKINFKGNKCSKNETPIINNYWKGTEKGCICHENNPLKNNKTQKSTIFKGECRRDLLSSKKCSNIPELPQMPYNIWKGTYFCAEKNSLSYFDLEITENIEDCFKNHLKPCGKIDTLGNILCVPKSAECPYNFHKGINSQENEALKAQGNNNNKGFLFKNFSNYLDYNDNNLNANKINERNSSSFLFKENSAKSGILSTNDINKSFYFTILNYLKNKNYKENNPKNKNTKLKKNKNNKTQNNSSLFQIPFIPVEFSLNSNPPCAYKGPIYSNSTNYILAYDYKKNINKKNNQNSCKAIYSNQLYDKSYIEIDSYQKKKIFEENFITEKIKTLPENDENKYSIKGNMKFYYRPYVGLKKKCFDQVKLNVKENNHLNLMYSNLSKSEFLLSQMKKNVEICFIMTLLVIISELIILKFLMDKNQEIILMVLYSFFIVLYGGAMIAFIAINNRKSWDLLLGVWNFVRPDCLDELGYNSTKGFLNAVNTTSYIATENMFILGILIAIEVYKFLMALDSYRKRTGNIEEFDIGIGNNGGNKSDDDGPKGNKEKLLTFGV